MRRRGSLLLAAFMLFEAVGFSLGAAQAGDEADALRQNITVCLETPLSAQDAELLLAQEKETAFVVWGELADQTVCDPDLGRSAQADVRCFCGSTELALPQALLAPDDERGCLLGEKTAWELFGGTAVVGDTICIGDAVRQVRAVIRQPENGVIVAGSFGDIIRSGGDKDETSCLNRITVDSRETAEAEAFLMRNALDGAVLRLDCLRNLAWLSELIPGKWSDFSGWKENYEQKKEELELLMQVQKNGVEVSYENACRLLAGNEALRLVCVWFAVLYLFRAVDQKAGRLFYHIRRIFSFALGKKTPFR